MGHSFTRLCVLGMVLGAVLSSSVACGKNANVGRTAESPARTEMTENGIATEPAPVRRLEDHDAAALNRELQALEKELEALELPTESDFSDIEEAIR